MSIATTQSEGAKAPSGGKPIINDAVITVATANGTGSQSANLILMRSIFSMGIPVSGKNMFPSNIQGLPTWFTIRVNENGWTARRRETDVLVAMNPETAAEDLESLRPGAYVVMRDSLKGYLKRDDLNVYEVPFDKLVREACDISRLRKMVVNIMYVGVLAYLLDIDFEEISRAIDRQFASKAKAATMNRSAAEAAYNWAKENLQKQDEFTLQRSEAAKGKIVIEGNQAAAIGALFGGVTVCAWYPITPSSSVPENLIDYLHEFRHDPETGKATYAIIQAEDELASIAMVVGAGWAGARAMTSTSGPGISLMAELVGLAYFAEIPGVIVDVQRVGPSTGLPTRTAQGDIAKAYYLSHGDCRHPLLIPGNPSECYEFMMEALNLAEDLQTIIFVMLDLDLGMNSWMCDPFDPPSKPISRGKVLDAEALDKVGEFARYRDVDGDGIPYRTLPGTNHPKAAYFTRGTGHTDTATYSEKPDDWQDNLDRLSKKFETAKTLLPQPVIQSEGSKIGILAYGSSDIAVQEARDEMTKIRDIKTDYLRLRALPASDAVIEFIEQHDITYVVEQNRDAQVTGILTAEHPHIGMKMKKLLHYCGLPLDAQTIVEFIVADQK